MTERKSQFSYTKEFKSQIAKLYKTRKPRAIYAS